MLADLFYSKFKIAGDALITAKLAMPILANGPLVRRAYTVNRITTCGKISAEGILFFKSLYKTNHFLLSSMYDSCI